MPLFYEDIISWHSKKDYEFRKSRLFSILVAEVHMDFSKITIKARNIRKTNGCTRIDAYIPEFGITLKNISFQDGSREVRYAKSYILDTLLEKEIRERILKMSSPNEISL